MNAHVPPGGAPLRLRLHENGYLPVPVTGPHCRGPAAGKRRRAWSAGKNGASMPARPRSGAGMTL